MRRITLLLFFSLFFTSFCYAQEEEMTEEEYQEKLKEFESQLEYQTGTIELSSDNATVKVPDGFKFLDKEQTNTIVCDFWGNPPDEEMVGMLVPSNISILSDSAYAFVISWSPVGFVKDNDAADIDYDELLEEIHEDEKETNKERAKNGYESIHLVGWASKPFYDSEHKTLHWAKELSFPSMEANTLNYEMRVLGRKGIISINAVADMRDFNKIKPNIESILASIDFKDGHRYEDFESSTDNVAAWTIGGLVAGKVLAKAGFFVLLAKFWKLIVLAVLGGGGYIVRLFRGRKKDGDKLEPRVE